MLDRLIKTCDVLVENFAPGALDRMGITWEHVQKVNPRMIVASIKGFGAGPYEACKVYENVAQCAGGAASTTGMRRRPAAGHRRADRRQRHRAAPGAGHRRRAVPAHAHAAAARRCWRRCRTRCSTCAASSCATSSGWRARTPCTSTRSTPTASSATRCRAPATPRAAASPAAILKCKGWETDPNAYIYFITQSRRVACGVQGHRRTRLDRRRGLRHAAGAPAAPEADLRPHRAVDHDQDQVRGHGDPEPATTFPAGRSCR